MWNKMKLTAQIRIALRREREREREKVRSQILCPYVRSLVANPKFGPDDSVFIMK
jgi:hypothetical protein